MRGPIHIALALLTLIPVAACGAATPPAPPAVTAPPEPADAVPWPELMWAVATMPTSPAGLLSEHIAAVAADPSAFVAVGSHQAAGLTDGAIWFSADGAAWNAVEEPAALEGVDFIDVAAGVGGFVAIGALSNQKGATVVAFRSDDGQRWERLGVPKVADSYASSVAGGPTGFVIAGNAGDGGSATWVSRDGKTWERVDRGAMGNGAAGVVDPQSVAQGWVALGPNVQAPRFLRSSDGIAWTAISISASTDAFAYRLISARWGYMAEGGQGSCGGLASCPAGAVAWWSADGDAWTRVPIDDSFTNGQEILAAAGDHGVIHIDSSAARASFTGWSWTPLSDPGDGSTAVNGAVVRDDVIVAVGDRFLPDGRTVGRIIVAQ